MAMACSRSGKLVGRLEGSAPSLPWQAAHAGIDGAMPSNAAFLDLIELQVDRGDGKGFVFLTYDTTPGYTDTAPLPATPVKWTFRGIYRVGDAQVGVWSKPVSVTVGG